VHSHLPQTWKLVAAFLCFCVRVTEVIDEALLRLELLVAQVPQADVGAVVRRVHLLFQGPVRRLGAGVGR
jgi:hypothetical protein